MAKKCQSKNCTTLFPEFGKNSSKADGIATTCKVCRREQVRASRYRCTSLLPEETRTCSSDECSKRFRTRVYNKKYCSLKCQKRSGHLRQVVKNGGQEDFNLRKCAINRIRSRQAEKRYKKYTEKDLKILRSIKSNGEVAKILKRSAVQISNKRSAMRSKEKNILSINGRSEEITHRSNINTFEDY
jgi:hypothetical protein